MLSSHEMWSGESFMRGPGGGHLGSKSAPCSPAKPFQKRAPAQPDSFHVIHKVPLGDSPYVKAKHVQLVDKDPDAAIALFWAAINAGDRVDSALKDMAIVMKQQNRPEEAIEAIKSLRFRCSDAAQESLDNVLLDLYKRCGRLDDQIALLKHKLHLIHQGMAFNGKRTKTARSQGKKFQVSIEQEATRLLGNLGWAYMQQSNFLAAEAVYRKALSIGPDNNKVCNLGICLMKQGRMEEAKTMLQSVVPACPDTRWGSDSHLKSYERAQEMLVELEASMGLVPPSNQLQSDLWQPHAVTCQQRSLGDATLEATLDYTIPFSGALSATAGFGPSQQQTSRPAPKKMASILGQQQRPNSHDVGANNQYASYQSSSLNAAAGWDDYDLGYTSPDENVDTNVQQHHGGNNNNSSQGYSSSAHFQLQQEMQQWPGEALRQKQDSFAASLSASENSTQPLGPRKLERSLTFGGAAPQRESSAYSGSDNNGFSSFPFPQMQRGENNFLGKASSSPSKGAFGERIPLTYDRTNSANTHRGGLDENAASKQASGGWASNAHKCPSAADENVASNQQIPSGWANSANTHKGPPTDDNVVAAKQTSSGWGKDAAAPFKISLGNPEMSFFSRWGYNENRPTARRSLSLESFDTQLQQIELENGEVDEGSFQFHGGNQVKRPRNHTPLKEKTTMWNSLGFTLPPEGLGHHGPNNEESHVASESVGTIAPAEHVVHSGVLTERQSSAPTGTSSASDAEMIKRQRRLRVFQEITLFPGSPQQIGV